MQIHCYPFTKLEMSSEVSITHPSCPTFESQDFLFSLAVMQLVQFHSIKNQSILKSLLCFVPLSDNYACSSIVSNVLSESNTKSQTHRFKNYIEVAFDQLMIEMFAQFLFSSLSFLKKKFHTQSHRPKNTFFYRDLLEAVELNRKRENTKTEQLTKHCKTILLPDRLHEAVDRRVKYVAK